MIKGVHGWVRPVDVRPVENNPIEITNNPYDSNMEMNTGVHGWDRIIEDHRLKKKDSYAEDMKMITGVHSWNPNPAENPEQAMKYNHVDETHVPPKTTLLTLLPSLPTLPALPQPTHHVVQDDDVDCPSGPIVIPVPPSDAHHAAKHGPKVNTLAILHHIKREAIKHNPSKDPGNPFIKSLERFVQADLNLLEDFIIDLIKIGLSNVEGLISGLLCTFGASVSWGKFKWYIANPFPWASAGVICGTFLTILSSIRN